MAISRLIRLFFLTVNVLIASLLVTSNSDFCASVFETQSGKLTPAALQNVFRDLFQCLWAKYFYFTSFSLK